MLHAEIGHVSKNSTCIRKLQRITQYVEIVCKFTNKKEENHKTNSYCFAFISPPFFTLKKVIIYLQKNVLQEKKTHKSYICVRKIISKQNIVLRKFSSIISKLNIILIFNSLAHGLDTHWYLHINFLATTIIFTEFK